MYFCVGFWVCFCEIVSWYQKKCTELFFNIFWVGFWVHFKCFLSTVLKIVSWYLRKCRQLVYNIHFCAGFELYLIYFRLLFLKIVSILLVDPLQEPGWESAAAAVMSSDLLQRGDGQHHQRHHPPAPRQLVRWVMCEGFKDNSPPGTIPRTE